MRPKRFFVYIMFIFSFVFFICPMFFEAFREINTAFEIKNYRSCFDNLNRVERDSINNFLYLDEKNSDIDKFLFNSNRVLGYVYIPKFNFCYVIYREDEDVKYFYNFDRVGFYFCSFGENSVCLKLKKTDSFDIVSYILENIGQNDEIYIDIFGKKNCFKFSGRKIISCYEEKTPVGFKDGFLSIRFDFPFSSREYCLVVKAEKLKDKNFEDIGNIYSLFINSRYFLIVACYVFLVFIFIIFVFIKRRRDISRKKLFI